MAWGRIRLQDQFALVFSYVDPQAGPSAKGAPMRGGEPSRDDAEDAVRRPSLTVRLGPGLRPVPLAADEVQRLALPVEPEWLSFFKPKQQGWHVDPFFAGRFHPEYPSDLEVLFFLPASQKVEQMWVQLDRVASEGTYEGTLLNTSHFEPTLTQGTRVTVRGAKGAKGPLWVSPSMQANAAGWTSVCQSCGFDALFEPVQALVARTFPDAPPGAEMLNFTTRCPMCNETMLVGKRETGAPTPEPEPEVVAAPAKKNTVLVVVAVTAAALGALVLWQLLD